ncbi:transglycosylase domain-containing protein [Macrococcus armenti]|uniref:transglycosylase domain-containing protein n=1 Tax=Macrococcus armenti TaxID=2875764 RepID=UPI001CC95D24|nr:transglycosylase domain-containing protein [Macrococcus armenti]UBH07602.1 penicillin-binding protein [Macrococcus armenti]UBH09835.1 penicillin-binding protein [Macrococcus armenti]
MTRKKKKRNIKKIILQIVGGLFLLFASLFICAMLLFLYYAYKAPKFDEAALRDQLPTKIYDKDDNLVTVLQMGQKRERIKFKEVPDQLKNAVLATEDNRFYEHGAIDFKRLTGAVFSNVSSGFGSQGASTITQQVVKRSFLTDKKSLERKAQEAYLSYRLEQEYSKDEIFEMYLNKIYYSDGIYGVKTAARYYFNKDLNQLTLAETAYLAGLPQVPNTYNIYDNPEAAEKRKDTVLYLMNRHGRITKAEMEEAQNQDLSTNLVQRTAAQRQNLEQNDPKYASYINVIKQEIRNNKEFEGKDLQDILTSGLSIYTNMDNNAQTSLQNNTDNMNIYKNKYQQAASSIVDTKTGALIAISGGRNYKDVVDRNLATDIHPVGSTIKPFLSYGPVIENEQWSTGHRIQDETEYDIHGIKFRNYDKQSHGLVTMRDAIRRSLNIPALKTFQAVQQEAGNNAPAKFAKNVGLNYKSSDLGPSDALGGSSSEFSPLQMASAYASFGNGGTYNEAHAIRKVVTQDNETINFEYNSRKAMEDYTAYMVTDMLKGTFEPYGTAYGSQIPGLNLAAKTGTGTYGDETYIKYNLPENAAKDVWIVGYSPRYTMSVWMGFTQMAQYGENSFVGPDEQSLPKELFRQVMSEISPIDGADFEMPDSVERSGGFLQVKGNPDNNITTSIKPNSNNETVRDDSRAVSNNRYKVIRSQPTTEEPATTERKTIEKPTTEAKTVEKPTTERATTEPTTTQPATTQPTTTQPATTQPASTQPATTQSPSSNSTRP